MAFLLNENSFKWFLKKPTLALISIVHVVGVGNQKTVHLPLYHAVKISFVVRSRQKPFHGDGSIWER